MKNRQDAKSAKGAWAPVFSITPKAAKGLMRIEAVRTEVAHIPLPPPVEAELRRQARVRSTHFSTRIEGNRLTLDEAERVIRDDVAIFHGRERDVSEVRSRNSTRGIWRVTTPPLPSTRTTITTWDALRQT